MIRRVLLAAVMATGVVAVAAPTASASGPADYHPHHHGRWEVVYRHHHHFHVYGVFYSLHDAERAAHRLRCDGHYGVEIRRVY
jgi:hypothetical protein